MSMQEGSKDSSVQSDVSKVLRDQSFMSSILFSLPGVDPNDPNVKDLLASLPGQLVLAPVRLQPATAAHRCRRPPWNSNKYVSEHATDVAWWSGDIAEGWRPAREGSVGSKPMWRT
ncbi:hypothetical protein J1N35_005809 [Gossypium stocksii]|uniref:Uncharacterized protein n=1 Tax=Gossypium stocksii TaxID=47602 RepID=A0A9D3WEK8_9ROSI|nr:hypothetical protein J1N35_005809 [Gossypium stocksii]